MAIYDIFIIDVNIDGENGITRAGQMKSCAPETEIIFMSGDDKRLSDMFVVRPAGF